MWNSRINIRYLFSIVKKYNNNLHLYLFLYTICASLLPILWIYLPTRIIFNLENNNTSIIIFITISISVITILTLLSNFFYHKYKLMVEDIRFFMIQEMINSNFNKNFYEVANKKSMEEMDKAYLALSNPSRGLSKSLINILNILSYFISILLFIFIFSKLPFYMTIFIVAVTLVSSLINKNLNQINIENWNTNAPYHGRLERLCQEFQDTYAREDMILYNFITVIKKYFFDTVETFTKNFLEFSYRRLKVISFSAFLNFIKDLIVLLYLLYLYNKNMLTIDQIYMYITSIMSFAVLFNSLTNEIMNFKENILMVESLRDNQRINENNSYINNIGNTVCLEIKNLYFRYNQNSDYVLKNINLRLEENDSLAIVGENGSGKSTLVSLIMRLYKPSKGLILLNGIDIWDYNKDEYYSKISTIFQDSKIYPFSIYDNIFWGRNDITNRKEIYEASNINDFLLKLDDYDNTSLSRIIDEKGVNLSGGQIQNLFLARAMAKKDFKILILDEPTANLDPYRESLLYRQYENLKENSISIFVSHRLNSTKFCDQIIYLRDGKIIEKGSHQELIKFGGEYKKMYEIQKKAFDKKK